MADIGVVIGHFLGLSGNRFLDLGAAIAYIDAIKPRECVEQLVAVTILNEHAFAAGDDAGRGLAAGVLGKMGRWVEEILPVPLGQLVVGQHSHFLF